jgi:hypothetical protein
MGGQVSAIRRRKDCRSISPSLVPVKVSIPQGNREESLGFLNEVREAASILVNLVQMLLQLIPWRFLFGKLQSSTRVFRKREYLRASTRKKMFVYFFLEEDTPPGFNPCAVISLLQNVPTLSQTEAPHLHIPQACNWKLSRNISPWLILLQRRREVVVEHSDRCMQVANPLIDIGPTPACQEGKEVHCI